MPDDNGSRRASMQKAEGLLLPSLATGGRLPRLAWRRARGATRYQRTSNLQASAPQASQLVSTAADRDATSARKSRSKVAA